MSLAKFSLLVKTKNEKEFELQHAEQHYISIKYSMSALSLGGERLKPMQSNF